MRIPDMLMNLEFVGRAEGDRRTYYVFKGRTRYLVVSGHNRGGFNLNTVAVETPDVILRRFAGERITTKMLAQSSRRPDLFRQGFDRLNSMYVMVALGKAKKLKQREGKAMVFRVAAH